MLPLADAQKTAIFLMADKSLLIATIQSDYPMRVMKRLNYRSIVMNPNFNASPATVANASANVVQGAV